jgi:histidinol-phosphate aminotransferase
LQRAAQTGAKLIYLSNPDNPMGSWHDGARLARMVEGMPDGTLLILDEAYVDLSPDGTAPLIDPDDRRVIRMRTFSKGYGMAGLRCGYAIGHPDLIRAFDKVRNHFGLGRIAQAGALAALNDQAHLVHVRSQVETARDAIASIARFNGLLPLPSATNFVTLDCRADGAFALRVLNALGERGVFVRKPFVAPQDRCIRVTCGMPAALDAFRLALPDALEAARA